MYPWFDYFLINTNPDRVGLWLALQSQQPAQAHKFVNVLGGYDGLDPRFLCVGVYFVQMMLGSRLRKQLLKAFYKSTVMQQVWACRVRVPLISNRSPFPQRCRRVEVDFDIFGGHSPS
jgi:hypothetical protein